MTRGKRIVLEILGPPAVGATLFAGRWVAAALWEWLTTGRAEQVYGDVLMGFGMMLIIAYIFAGAQSIVYTAIMEWRFSRGLDPRSWRSVGLSTLLGFASGAAICVGYGFHRSDVLSNWVFFGGIGLSVGFLLGMLIKALSAKSSSGV